MPSHRLAFFLPFFLGLALSETRVKTCYTPLGENRNKQLGYADGYSYAACDNVAEHSMCCVIGYGKDISEADFCRSDGLCYNPNHDQYWRESCTDPSWQHPACVKLFVNGTGFDGEEPARDGNLPLSDVLVTPCLDGSYCSGNGASATQCCESGQGLYISDGNQVDKNPNTTAKASSTSSSSQPGQTIIYRKEDGLTSGAGIGIGLAVGIVVSLTTAGIVFFFLRRRKLRGVASEQTITSEVPAEPIHEKTELEPPPHLFEIAVGPSESKTELSVVSDRASRVELA